MAIWPYASDSILVIFHIGLEPSWASLLSIPEEPSNIEVTSATTAAVTDITESSENLCMLCDLGYSSSTNFQMNPID